MASKNQQTFAKLARERRLKEKRERKAEKKAAAAAARAGLTVDGPDAVADETDARIEGDGNG
jgi:hypothetical protein